MTANLAGRFAAGAFLSAALLAGCSSSTPAPVPAGPAQQLLSNPHTVGRGTITNSAQLYGHDSFVYTAQLYGHDAKVYKRKGLALTYQRTLTKGLSDPQGTMATNDGWWYIANGGRSNVLIYRKAHGHRDVRGPLGSLDDYGQMPVNVSLTPSRRLIAVSNGSTMGGGAGSVSIYLDRQAEPSRTLTYGSDVVQGEGVAVDRKGDCFWSFNDGANGGSIVEFAKCNGTGTLVATPPIGVAGGMAFDQSGDLFYVDQSSGIYRCKHTANCELWLGVGSELGIPTNINFDHKSKFLWIADATGYIDAVDSHTGAVTRIQANDGPSDPPFGVAPEPGG
jgi:DNA-binding beta-propeller fold protein YncE